MEDLPNKSSNYREEAGAKKVKAWFIKHCCLSITKQIGIVIHLCNRELNLMCQR